MVIENKYDIGQVVYLKTDPDQLARIVISMEIYAQGEIQYKLSCGSNFSYHYDFEITEEKDSTKLILE